MFNTKADTSILRAHKICAVIDTTPGSLITKRKATMGLTEYTNTCIQEYTHTQCNVSIIRKTKTPCGNLTERWIFDFDDDHDDSCDNNNGIYSLYR